MLTVPEQLTQSYGLRREVSQTADLAVLLLARLLFGPVYRQPAVVSGLVRKLQSAAAGEPLRGVNGRPAEMAAFGAFLWDYAVVNRTAKGVSFYPFHPALTLSTNGEGSRVEGYMSALAATFTPEQATALCSRIVSDGGQTGFERLVRDVVEWQLDGPLAIEAAPVTEAVRRDESRAQNTVRGALETIRDDLLALSREVPTIMDFTTHAGRLLAFGIARYLLAGAGVELDLPIYTAPAADSHEGVRGLAHEIIEVHRARLGAALRRDFQATVVQAATDLGMDSDPEHEAPARVLTGELFDRRANIVPPHYASLRDEHGSYAGVAEHYYWTHTGARVRFLRQLHASHLNLAKKAGIACSRSRYSQWHYYWLAPGFIDTLLLVTQARLGLERMLVDRLLTEWRERYGIAVLVDETWDDVYRRSFRGLGSPQVLNEANRRRFIDILGERGRLHKNSDEFPWVLLRS